MLSTHAFATTPVQAVAMVGRALDAGMPGGWVTADVAYGQDSKFRTALDQCLAGYVVAVPRNQTVSLVVGTARIDTLAAQSPSMPGNGSRPVTVRKVRGSTTGRWRPHSGRAHPPQHHRPDDLAFYLCAGPPTLTIENLVRAAGARWAIEMRHWWCPSMGVESPWVWRGRGR